MEFHPDKCKVLRIKNKRKVIKYSYLLHNVILKEASNANYLGVTMNNRLSWKKPLFIKSAVKLIKRDNFH